MATKAKPGFLLGALVGGGLVYLVSKGKLRKFGIGASGQAGAGGGRAAGRAAGYARI